MRTNTHSVISIIGIIHSLSWYILNSIISSSDNIFLILLGCPPTSALSGSQLLSVDMMIKLKNKVSHNESEVGKIRTCDQRNTPLLLALERLMFYPKLFHWATTSPSRGGLLQSALPYLIQFDLFICYSDHFIKYRW